MLNRFKVITLSILNDKTYAKLKYKENTGNRLDLERPTTFNEKIWWLKLNNRNPLLTTCTDKYKVREYIKEKGLADILVPIYGLYNDARNISFEKIPSPAFIKTNHGSGINIIWDKDKPFNKKNLLRNLTNR